MKYLKTFEQKTDLISAIITNKIDLVKQLMPDRNTKHIKLFENKYLGTEYLWLFDYYSKEDEDHSYLLFSDEDSCKNYIIEVINEEREDFEISEGNTYDDSMYFIDIEDALNWIDINNSGVSLSYEEVDLHEYKMSDKLKEMRQMKKYNL